MAEYEIDPRVFGRIREGTVEIFDDLLNRVILYGDLGKFDSAIEEIMCRAVLACCAAAGVSPIRKKIESAEGFKSAQSPTGDVLYIEQQKAILGRRVDFWFEYTITHKGRSGRATAIVECDGREFHHGNEKYAAADKARDRELASQARFIFRYTGSELYKDPFGCAFQCLIELRREAARNFGDAG